MRAFEDPAGRLLVPDQRVADHEQTVLGAESGELVRCRELKPIGLRMDGVPLQDVLRTDRVEVVRDDRERPRVLAGDLRVVQRGAEEETSFQDLPKGGVWVRTVPFRRACDAQPARPGSAGSASW